MNQQRKLGAGRRSLIAAVALAGLIVPAVTLSCAEEGQNSPSPREPRIIGGGDAKREDGPWMAALLKGDDPDHVAAHHCGGVVIHPRWVLTAAHCLDKILRPQGVVALVGTHDLNTGGVRMKVEEFIVHPDYTIESFDSDIALLRLEEPVPSSVGIMTIIDNEGLALPGTIGTVLGWGQTSNSPDDEGSSTLRITTVPIVSNSTANREEIHDGKLNENMLAAGSILGGNGVCFGDSGGPLLVRDLDNDRLVLAGLASNVPVGIGCGEPNSLGAYTRVSKFRSWIYSHVFPDYLAWEEQHGVIGESVDGDHDGSNNWGEYASLTDPNDASSTPSPVPFRYLSPDGKEYPAITFMRRTDFKSLGIAYEVQVSSDLKTWETLSLDDLQTTEPVVDPDDQGRQALSVRAPTTLNPSDPAPSYFQLRAMQIREEKPSVGGSTATRFSFPGVAEGTLQDSSNSDIEGRRYIDYRITSTLIPGRISFALRSQDFNARLQIFNHVTGELLYEDPSSSGGRAQDDLISFVVEEGVVYRLRASTFEPNQYGSFSLRGFTIPLGVPIVFKGTRNGTLSNADSSSGDFPEIFRQDDYLFRNFTFALARTTVSMNSNALDAFLILQNLETGEVIDINNDLDPRLGNNARIVFNAEPGVNYLFRATSAMWNETGAYTLIVE